MDITALLNGLTPSTDNRLKSPDAVGEIFSEVLAAASNKNVEVTELLTEVSADTPEQLAAEAAQVFNGAVSVEAFQTNDIAETVQTSDESVSVDKLQTTENKDLLLDLTASVTVAVATTADQPQTQSDSTPVAVADSHPLTDQSAATSSSGVPLVSPQLSEEVPTATLTPHYYPRSTQVNTAFLNPVADNRVQVSDLISTEARSLQSSTEPAGSLLPTEAVAEKSNFGASVASAARQGEAGAITPALAITSDHRVTKPTASASTSENSGTVLLSSVHTSQAATDYTVQTHASSAPLGQVTGDASIQGPQVGSLQSSPASNPASTILQSPLTSRLWGRELEQQMVGLVQRGDNSVELQLNPRELGPLSVSLTLEDQSAKLQFFSAHTVVRSAVEQAIPQLRDALAQQGITLAEALVGEQQQEQRNGANQGHHQMVAGDNEVIQETTVVSTTPATTSMNTRLGGVDLYA